MATSIVNATVVLANQVLTSESIRIEDGLIVDIGHSCAGEDEIIDLQGDYLLPGLVDFHCDAIEKEIEPRPTVYFPLDFALSESDKRNAGAGITTVFHAVAFADQELGVRNRYIAREIIRTIRQFRHGSLVDHRVHVRYEVTDIRSLAILQGLIEERAVDVVSVMDHTPGKGQFRERMAYVEYLSRTYGNTAAEADALIQQKLDNECQTDDMVQWVADLCREHRVPLASHDDDSVQRLEWLRELGVKIAEFPINLETAAFAREQQMPTVFGAPNILRGGSHHGAIRAIDAVEQDVISILCSDYAPATLLPAVIRITETTDWSLPQAVGLASLNPALALGLNDRGSIEKGKRADLIAVGITRNYPQVRATWVGGERKWARG